MYWLVLARIEKWFVLYILVCIDIYCCMRRPLHFNCCMRRYVTLLNACYVGLGPVFFSTYEECKGLINVLSIQFITVLLPFIDI